MTQCHIKASNIGQGIEYRVYEQEQKCFIVLNGQFQVSEEEEMFQTYDFRYLHIMYLSVKCQLMSKLCAMSESSPIFYMYI